MVSALIYASKGIEFLHIQFRGLIDHQMNIYLVVSPDKPLASPDLI